MRYDSTDRESVNVIDLRFGGDESLAGELYRKRRHLTRRLFGRLLLYRRILPAGEYCFWSLPGFSLNSKLHS